MTTQRQIASLTTGEGKLCGAWVAVMRLCRAMLQRPTARHSLWCAGAAKPSIIIVQ